MIVQSFATVGTVSTMLMAIFFVLVLWTKLCPSKKSIWESPDLYYMFHVGHLEVRSDEVTRMVVIRLDWRLCENRER